MSKKALGKTPLTKAPVAKVVPVKGTSLVRDLDALPIAKDVHVEFAHRLVNLTPGPSSVDERGLVSLSLARQRELLRCIAEEMDERPFILKTIGRERRRNAIASGGDGTLNFNWAHWRKAKVSRTFEEMQAIRPLRSVQTLADHEKHVAEWTTKREGLMSNLRRRYGEYLGEPYTGTDAGLLRDVDDLLERVVTNTTANAELYQRWHAVDSAWLGLNHADNVLARHLFNLKKAQAAGDAVTDAVFKKTGDAVVDGIGYSIPGNAEQWQYVFTAVPGHEGSAFWGPIVHEGAHDRWFELLTKADRDDYSRLYSADFKAGKLISPSEYGIKESNKTRWLPGTEHFAECFQTWRAYKLTGDSRYLQLIPKWAITFFEKVG